MIGSILSNIPLVLSAGDCDIYGGTQRNFQGKDKVLTRKVHTEERDEVCKELSTSLPLVSSSGITCLVQYHIIIIPG